MFFWSFQKSLIFGLQDQCVFYTIKAKLMTFNYTSLRFGVFGLFLVSGGVFLISFVSGRKHLLATLLSLEGVTLVLFGLLSWIASMWSGLASFILLFLTFVACEGALGLSLLVIIVRWWGEDRVLSLNLLRR